MGAAMLGEMVPNVESYVPEPVGDRPALPYAPFPIPKFRKAQGANWKLWQAYFPAGAGYFLGHRQIRHMQFGLMRNNEAWMTVNPMEIESQWPHLEAASGHVLIGGLGMAIMAYAVAAKPEVTKVTVVERDAEVIALARDFAGMDDWPTRDKVDIVEHDLLTYRHDPAAVPVDFLYVDIWRTYRNDPKVAHMQTIHAHVPAPRVGYWGQEIEAVDWAVAKGIPVDAFTADTFRAFCEETGLPLIGLEEPSYPQLCAWAATNPAIAGAATA